MCSERKAYNLKILGISETRWNGANKRKLRNGDTIIYSGYEEGHAHEHGVGLLIAPETMRTLIAWEPISPRIITARFYSKGRNISVIQCYAPTNTSDDEEKEDFYEQLQDTYNNLPKRDTKILMGDLNAKVGTDNVGKELIMGKHGTGERNENGELLVEMCSFNNLIIGGTIFPHKDIHKTTWNSPDGRTKNQIDHFTIEKKWRRSLLDVRVMRGADVASDHQLVVATLKIKLRAHKDKAGKPSPNFHVLHLKNSSKSEEFKIELKNRFDALSNLNETTVEEHWQQIKTAWNTSCQNVLGRRTYQSKEWISDASWELIKDRKRMKQRINNTKDMAQKEILEDQYRDLNKETKTNLKKDKKNYINELAEEAETAAAKGDVKKLYDTTRVLSGKKANISCPVKDKDGNAITNETQQRERWMEHFKEILNRPPPSELPSIPEVEDTLNVNTNPPSKAEVKKAIKSMKSGKAAGPDGIPPEALKGDINTSTDMLCPLFEKIWEKEEVPLDWKKGHLVKIPKKGDLATCGNWRGITLLSIPGKVMSRIILERLKTALDKKLRDEQAGFRQGKSCTDQIASLRIIIEQSMEWQTPLYMTFVDFQKAFDSVDRGVIWKLMKHYGIPDKFINIIKRLYENSTCQVIHDGKLTNPFNVETGVRQGCLLSPTIFLLFIDWIMRSSTSGCRTGIQWTFTKHLEDLDFADDICLLSQRYQDAQSKLTKVAEEAAKTGLKINVGKTEVMRINEKNANPLQLEGRDITETEKFTYLGSVVDKHGGADEDIKSRINKARASFISLKTIWASSAISRKNKVRIFNSNVKAVLLYGSETWKVTKTNTRKLQVFVNKCLKRILKIRWPQRITNEELWERTNQQPIAVQIRKRKWGWIGHTLRKPTNNITRQSLQWNPQGQRKRGRPRQTWRRSTEMEIKDAGMSWTTLKRDAQNRVRWRSVALALCSSGNPQAS